MHDAASLYAAARGRLKNGGPALSLPLPRRRAAVEVVFMVYAEAVRQGAEELVPPRALLVFDPRTGALIAEQPCRPRDFGVDAEPDARSVGFGLELRGAEYRAGRDRLLAIATGVWESFAGAAPLDSAAVARVREHDEIFARIAKKPLLPYYESLGAEYFLWSRAL
jgi:hypothetical protein